jgi:hypothetical protein
MKVAELEEDPTDSILLYFRLNPYESKVYIHNRRGMLKISVTAGNDSRPGFIRRYCIIAYLLRLHGAAFGRNQNIFATEITEDTEKKIL